MAIHTIAGLIRSHGADHSDQTAIIAGDRRITYAQLDARSNQVANALADAGVGYQDRVAFLDKNSPEQLEITFGAAKLGAVLVTVNWRLAPPEVAYIVNDSDAKVLVVGQEFTAVLDAIADQLTTAGTIVVIGEHGQYQSYDEWVSRQSEADPGGDSAPDDVALQLYSSGTTGRPKGVMLTNQSDADTSSLQLVLYGASPISEPVLVGAIAMFGPVFMQAYGLTETTGQIVSMSPSDHDPGGDRAYLLRAAGKPDPGVELRIVDPTTVIDVGVGEVGEILVHSDQNMKGYWKLPEETAHTLLDGGWLRTGDAGYVDADGYLFIHDRVKDMIVSGGENIYPAEIENALMSHPAVADVAVVGVPHERWGETPLALVVKVPGAEVAGPELIDHCRVQLARYKCPTAVEWVEVLPRNPSGKVLKRELRAPYWEGRDRLVQ